MVISGDPTHLMKAHSGYLLNTSKSKSFEEEPEPEENQDPDGFFLPWLYEVGTQNEEFAYNEVNDVPAEVVNDPEVNDDPAKETPTEAPKIKRLLYMAPEYVEEFNLVTDKVCIEPVEMLVEFQKNHESPLAKRLTPQVLEKAREHFGKMDAKNHLAIFHKDTASAITFMVANHGWPKEYLTTAQHIFLVYRWWEIVSERGLNNAFSKNHPKQRQEMIDYLEWFEEYIAKFRYHPNQKLIRTVQKGSISAAEAVLHLQDKLLKDPNVTHFSAARGVLIDIIENHHFRVREKNKNPTPLQVKRIQKGLMVTQLLNKVGKGHNYLQDDSDKTMFDFSTLDQILKEEEKENEEAEAELQEYHQYCIDNNFDPRDFQNDDQCAEANSLTKFIGYCIDKKLKGKICHCKKWYRKQKDSEVEDPLNKLLETNAIFSTHKFCNPSYLANTVFHMAEQLFRENRSLNIHVKKMDVKLKDFISSKLKAKFPEIPDCKHFESILQLFVKGRLCYYAKHLDKFGHQEHSREIVQGASHASKSTASMVLITNVK